MTLQLRTRETNRALPTLRRYHLTVFGLGVVSLLAYAGIALLAPLSPSRLSDPRAALISASPLWSTLAALSLPAPTGAAAGLAMSLILALTALAAYVVALSRARRRPDHDLPGGLVIVVFSAAVAIAVTAMPHLGADIFMYLLYARVLEVHQANPYILPPAHFAADPFLRFGDWNQTTSPYGPVWTLLSAFWVRLWGGTPAAAVLAFRLLLAAFTLACAALIAWMSGRLHRRRSLALLIFGWNPIVALWASDHIEPVMVFFVLLSLACHLSRRETLAIVLLTLSVLTKFVTAPLLIAYLVFLWRARGAAPAARGVAIALGLTVLAFWPFWEGWETVRLLAQEPSDGGTLNPFSYRYVLFGVTFAATLVWIRFRAGVTPRDLIRIWSVILILFVWLAAPTHYSWYAITLVAVVSLSTSSRLLALTAALTTSALLTHVLGLLGHIEVARWIWLLRVIWWAPTSLTLAWIYRAKVAAATHWLARTILLLRPSLSSTRT